MTDLFGVSGCGLLVRLVVASVAGDIPSPEFMHDLPGRRVRDEGPRLVVAVLGPEVDRFHQGTYVREGAAVQAALAESTQAPRDMVHSRRDHGCQVQVQAGPLGVVDPALDLLVHVSREVARHDMYCKVAQDVEVVRFEAVEHVCGDVALWGVVEQQLRVAAPLVAGPLDAFCGEVAVSVSGRVGLDRDGTGRPRHWRLGPRKGSRSSLTRGAGATLSGAVFRGPVDPRRTLESAPLRSPRNRCRAPRLSYLCDGSQVGGPSSA